ncbi:hypothetical protein GGX14DRAFT_390425 [Mycena pura]|uniref:Uncharacterized protein n=1 Tax=Mycena pura TaxID=153505 RepID=A0AAD6YK91_9AGAR|nr:hypothetical protein GGX14DRAFT_390425 [Mycena pura]
MSDDTFWPSSPSSVYSLGLDFEQSQHKQEIRDAREAELSGEQIKAEAEQRRIKRVKLGLESPGPNDKVASMSRRKYVASPTAEEAGPGSSTPTPRVCCAVGQQNKQVGSSLNMSPRLTIDRNFLPLGLLDSQATSQQVIDALISARDPEHERTIFDDITSQDVLSQLEHRQQPPVYVELMLKTTDDVSQEFETCVRCTQAEAERDEARAERDQAFVELNSMLRVYKETDYEDREVKNLILEVAIRIGGGINFVRMKGRGKGILELECYGIIIWRKCKVEIVVVEIGVTVGTEDGGERSGGGCLRELVGGSRSGGGGASATGCTSKKAAIFMALTKAEGPCNIHLMPFCFWRSRDLQADWIFSSLSENDGRAGIQRVAVKSTNAQVSKTRARAISENESTQNFPELWGQRKGQKGVNVLEVADFDGPSGGNGHERKPGNRKFRPIVQIHTIWAQ